MSKQVNVRSTSKAAFFDHRSSGKEASCTQKTLEALQRIGKGSRRMISEESGFPVNCITQYVKNLIKKNLVQEIGKFPCGVSRKKVNFLAPIESE